MINLLLDIWLGRVCLSDCLPLCFPCLSLFLHPSFLSFSKWISCCWGSVHTKTSAVSLPGHPSLSGPSCRTAVKWPSSSGRWYKPPLLWHLHWGQWLSPSAFKCVFALPLFCLSLSLRQESLSLVLSVVVRYWESCLRWRMRPSQSWPWRSSPSALRTWHTVRGLREWWKIQQNTSCTF